MPYIACNVKQLMSRLRFYLTIFIFSASSIWTINTAYCQLFKLGAGGSVHAFTSHLGDVNDKDIFQPKWSVGYSPGIFTNIMFSDNFSLQTEFYYSWQGRKLVTKESGWYHRARYQYIEVPILLRKTFDIKLYKDIPTTWFFNVGPNIKYWTKGKGNVITGENVEVEYDVVFGSPPEDSFPFEYMYLSDVNRLMFGLTAGVGFSIDVVKFNTLFLEMRYTHGHTYFGKKDSHRYNVLGFQDTMLSNPRTITFTAAYMLEFNYFQLQQKSNLKKHKKAPKPRKR